MQFTLYRQLDRLFPQSYTLKILSVAFAGMHIPLLAIVGYALATGALTANMPVVLLALGATVLGTALTLLCLHGLLKPILTTEAAMAEFEFDGTIAPLPRHHRDAVGRLMRRASRLMRASRLKLATAKLEAQTDPLTGLLNRRGFQDALTDAASGGLLVLDIDHFKRINDTHGHQHGDEVLLSVARILREKVRAEDIVARAGGEEFIVFLPGTNGEAALAIAERVRATIELARHAGETRVTISIGAALRHDDEEISQLMTRADAALYAAKTTGRNRVVEAAGLDRAAEPGRPMP